MRDLGVGCIICCLDDGELALLGAPWDLYSDAARSAGIDVLRIPTPEGLAPLSPEVLDEKLGDVLRDYTLRGVPVLVHCRGGVGRAGVVAACWAIKLGLCGWLDEGAGDSVPRPGDNTARLGDEVDPAVVGLVERAIFLLRRRRSIKAIETYEQVRFLVEYVEYLRGTRRSDSMDSDMTLASL